MEPDVPGSEDLPLWKPEGPAAHAEAMVHFQRCLSGRVIKHQVRPSNPNAAGGRPPGSLTGSCSVPTDHFGSYTSGGTEGTLWGGEGWQERRFNLEDGDGVSCGGTQVQTLLPTDQGGISGSKLRFSLLYPLSLSFILVSTTLVFCILRLSLQLHRNNL